MILLDTHAWIWLSSDAEKLSPRAAKAIAGAKQLGLSAISCWEFAMLVEKGRISVDRQPLEWIEQSLENHGIALMPLTPAIAVHACRLGPGFHGDPADRIIVSTSIIQGAPIVTKDERIRSCRIVESIW